MGIKLAAALWGFAEGTLFFIVPDVLLSATGLVDVRKSVVACFYALAGALVGGAVMYYWGVQDTMGALRVLDAIPGISPEMLSKVHADLTDMGAWAVFKGPLMGVPYKIYGVQAHPAGVGLVAFLVASVPARLIRFLAVTIALPFLTKRIVRRGTVKRKMTILLTGWTLFYAYYFFRMAG